MNRCRTGCLAIAVGVASVVLYATTIVTTVGWTDTGELMAVAHTLGTAHPTGYPLMTVLARMWLLIPMGLRTAVHLNLLSTMLVAIATGLFAGYLRIAFTNTRNKGTFEYAASAAGIGAAVLATSLTYWTQASSYEVYALHLCLMSSILLAYALAVAEQASRPTLMSRWWFVFAYLVGFGSANHMTTVLLGPGLLWDYFRRHGTSRSSWRRIGRMAIAGLAGLSMYLVLPIRATSWPPLNWGDPATWDAFWRHVTGAQYRVWMFSSAEVMSRQWSAFVAGLTDEFIWPWLAIALWGWTVAWRRWRRSAELITIFAVTGILYSINYDIHEIGPYFLIVYAAIAFAIVPGLVDLNERMGRGSLRGVPWVALASVALVIWQAVEHHPQIERANTPAIERFARDVLMGVEPRAVILTGRWDYLYSPALYLQHVERVRTDVLVIDHSLLRDRPWYVESLRRRAPWLERALKDEFDAFLHELRKFERGEPFTPAVIQMRWDAFWSGIIRVAAEAGPVYMDVRLAAELRAGPALPDGHLVRLYSESGAQSGRMPVWIPIDGKESAYSRDFRDYLASSFLHHAMAAQGQGRTGLADSLARVGAAYSPRHPWLSSFALTRK